MACRVGDHSNTERIMDSASRALGTKALLIALLGAAVVLGAAAQSPYCRLDASTLCVGNYHLYEGLASSPFDNLLDGYSGNTSNARPEFADLDGDGDVDMLVGLYTGGVLYFENTGNATHVAFTERTGAANPMDGADVGFRSDVCALDADGDGDLDLLVVSLVINGSFSDSVGRGGVLWNNTGSAASPVFEQQNETTFDDLMVSLHALASDNGSDYSPSLEAVDLDNDGDMDIIAVGEGSSLHFFDNVGTPQLPNMTARNFSLSGTELDSGEGNVAAGDYDNDGDTDIIAGTWLGSVSLFMNFGSNKTEALAHLSGESNPFFGLWIDRRAAISLVDIDADNDLDLVYADDALLITLFENVDSRSLGRFSILPDAASPMHGANVVSYASPTLWDWDDDGDMDMIVAARSLDGEGTVHLWQFDNVGTATAPDFEWAGQTQEAEFLPFSLDDNWLRPAVADLDDDGDMDLVVGDYRGWLFHWSNDGNVTHRNLSRVAWGDSPFGAMDVGWQAAPTLFDADDDGDLDLLVGEWGGTLLYFENTGSADTAAYTQRTGADNPFNDIVAPTNRNAVPTMLDIESDGDLDLLLADYIGGLTVYTNVGNRSVGVWTYDCDNDFFRDTDVGDVAAADAADLDGDGDTDVVVGTWTGELFVYMRGRCFAEQSCNNHGGCVDEGGSAGLTPSCQCFLGWGSDQCATCQSGFWGSSCDLCPGAGTARSPTLSNVCSRRGLCDDGIEGDGSCACNAPFHGEACELGQCAAGHEYRFNSTTGLYECHPCAVGEAKAEQSNNATCELCDTDLGFTTASTGASSCDACIAGYFEQDGACLKCVSGMECVEDGLSVTNVPLRQRYWRSAASTSTLEECPLSGACAGGTGSGSELCNDGYTGPACAVCDSNSYYDRGSNSCEPCESNSYSPATIVVFCVLALLFLLILKLVLFPKGTTCLQGMSKVRDVVVHVYEETTLEDLCWDRAMTKISPASEEEESGEGEDKGESEGDGDGEGEEGAEERKDGTAGADADAAVTEQPPATGEAATAGVGVGASAGADGSGQEKEEGEEEGHDSDGKEVDYAKLANSFRTKAKIVLSFVQIVSSLPWALGDLKWPTLFGAFSVSLSFVNLDLVQVLPMDCVVRTDYVDELVMMTVAPIVVALIIVSIGVIDFMRHAPSVEEQKRLKQMRLFHTDEQWEIRILYTELLLLLSFLIFPSVSSKVFRTFQCVELQDGSAVVLEADYSIDCEHDDRYVFAQAWAAVMVLVYPVGIPLTYFLLLFRLRGKLNPTKLHDKPWVFARARQLEMEATEEGKGGGVDSEAGKGNRRKRKPARRFVEAARKESRLMLAQKAAATFNTSDEIMSLEVATELAKEETRAVFRELQPLRFLFEAYEPRVWWWEVFECVRRLFLSALLVFIYNGSSTQVVVALLVNLATMEMFTKFGPYHDDSDDLLAEVGSWSTFGVLFAALLLRVDATADDERSQAVLSVILILITLAAPVIGTTQMMYENLVELEIISGDEIQIGMMSTKKVQEFYRFLREQVRLGTTDAPGPESAAMTLARTGSTGTNAEDEEEDAEEEEEEEEGEGKATSGTASSSTAVTPFSPKEQQLEAESSEPVGV